LDGRHLAVTARRAALVAGGVAIAVLVLSLIGCETDNDDVRAPRLRARPLSRENVGISFEGTAREAEPPPPTLSELIEGGRHWRFVTAHGPVHVWVPRGYDAKRAETVVYVHGFYSHVDDAWNNYSLARQFASSAINAMFIVPEAPASGQERVAWESLADLLATVEASFAASGQASGDVKLPRRRIVTIGHSGAWRTLLGWLDEPELDTVVLVDAAYGEIEQYKKWVLASDDHRLIDVGDDTREWTDRLHAALPESVVLNDFPSVEEGIPASAAKARILYIRSNVGHFPLVTNGVALPMILRTLRAKRLVRVPLAEILDSATP
jgi:hypothetical protein